uniref:Uncharacterized protein n=1 Tax=Anguilla anguilla TaxID=7936 RepID=A0A0E9R4T0_ANGAN
MNPHKNNVEVYSHTQETSHWRSECRSDTKTLVQPRAVLFVWLAAG